MKLKCLKHSGGVWAILLVLVLPIQCAAKTHQAAWLPFLRVTIGRHEVHMHESEWLKSYHSENTPTHNMPVVSAAMCISQSLYYAHTTAWPLLLGEMFRSSRYISYCTYEIKHSFWFHMISYFISDFESFCATNADTRKKFKTYV